MIKKSGFALALALVSGVAFAGVPAGTMGIGVSHSGDGDSSIYVPIVLERGFWIEPFVSYSHTEDKASDLEVTNINVGVGLFKNFFTTAHTRAYFGGRVGYSYYLYDPANSASTPATEDNGFMVQPTIGFGYEPVNNILFGAEAYVAYNDSDIKGQESLSTGTSLFVRYYFAR